MGFDFPHAEKDGYIITQTARPNIGSVKFYTDNLKSLVERLKSENEKKYQTSIPWKLLNDY